MPKIGAFLAPGGPVDLPVLAHSLDGSLAPACPKAGQSVSNGPELLLESRSHGPLAQSVRAVDS